MRRVSIVLACYNGEATLGETLDSLAAQKYDGPWEIVFANNGSTDSSVEIFKAAARRHPAVTMRLVDASAEQGKAFALNVGIRAARGDAILTFDADDTVEPGWLAAMAAALERHDIVAARMNFVRLNPGWVRDYRASAEERVLGRAGHAPYCDLAGGCQLGFTRRAFNAVGDYDAEFAALEDHDWCIRAFLKGYRIHPAPEAVVNYRFRDDPKAIYRQTYAYSRYRALLRRRYDPEPLIAPLPWIELAELGVRTAGKRLVDRLRGEDSALSRARYARIIGGLLGDAAGAIKFGVAPSRSRRSERRAERQAKTAPARAGVHGR